MSNVAFINDNFERHQCEAERNEDWLIFTCPQCDYIRRLNWRTGEMKSKGGSSEVLHEGYYQPPGIDPSLLGNSAN